jgi:periplasmic protein TonB
MIVTEKKSKQKGIIGTILFHILLLVAFFFMGLTYQDPPPEEEGISINFGFTDEGLGEVETKDTEEIIDPSNVQRGSPEDIVTQTNIETRSVKKTRKKKKKVEQNEDEESIEEERTKVNKEALYTGKKKTKINSEGNKKGEGNRGIMNGDSNAEAYEGGGIGEDGTAYQLGGRKANIKPKPQGNQVEGKVVVAITVDRLGNVINAISGVQGSTTLDKQLLQRAKRTALKTKFEAKESAPTNQHGKIIYSFKLN